MEDTTGIPVVEVEVSAAHQSRIPLWLGHPILGMLVHRLRSLTKTTRKMLSTVFDVGRQIISLRIVQTQKRVTGVHAVEIGE